MKVFFAQFFIKKKMASLFLHFPPLFCFINVCSCALWLLCVSRQLRGIAIAVLLYGYKVRVLVSGCVSEACNNKRQ